MVLPVIFRRQISEDTERWSTKFLMTASCFILSQDQSKQKESVERRLKATEVETNCVGSVILKGEVCPRVLSCLFSRLSSTCFWRWEVEYPVPWGSPGASPA